MKNTLQILMMSAFLVMGLNGFAQENTVAYKNTFEYKLAKLSEEKADIKQDLVRAQDKLSGNRVIKGIGIGLTGVGAFVAWPAVVPGVVMWACAPTKKWVRKEEKLQEKLEEVEDEIELLIDTSQVQIN